LSANQQRARENNSRLSISALYSIWFSETLRNTGLSKQGHCFRIVSVVLLGRRRLHKRSSYILHDVIHIRVITTLKWCRALYNNLANIPTSALSEMNWWEIHICENCCLKVRIEFLSISTFIMFKVALVRYELITEHDTLIHVSCPSTLNLCQLVFQSGNKYAINLLHKPVNMYINITIRRCSKGQNCNEWVNGLENKNIKEKFTLQRGTFVA